MKVCRHIWLPVFAVTALLINPALMAWSWWAGLLSFMVSMTAMVYTDPYPARSDKPHWHWACSGPCHTAAKTPKDV